MNEFDVSPAKNLAFGKSLRNERSNAMNVNEYMERDFELLEKRIDHVRKAYEHQDPSRTIDQATEMFDAFQRRFATEDFLLSKVHQTASMKSAIEKFNMHRRRIREILEDMLMLHVSEPDFLSALRQAASQAKEYLRFVEDEFVPQCLDQISEDDRKNMSTALEDRFHRFAMYGPSGRVASLMPD
jgi:hypothetical protein